MLILGLPLCPQSARDDHWFRSRCGHRFVDDRIDRRARQPRDGLTGARRVRAAAPRPGPRSAVPEPSCTAPGCRTTSSLSTRACRGPRHGCADAADRLTFGRTDREQTPCSAPVGRPRLRVSGEIAGGGSLRCDRNLLTHGPTTDRERRPARGRIAYMIAISRALRVQQRARGRARPRAAPPRVRPVWGPSTTTRGCCSGYRCGVRRWTTRDVALVGTAALRSLTLGRLRIGGLSHLWGGARGAPTSGASLVSAGPGLRHTADCGAHGEGDHHDQQSDTDDSQDRRFHRGSPEPGAYGPGGQE